VENYLQDIQPSLLIVDPDEHMRSILESFFSRVGWSLQSWDGDCSINQDCYQQKFDLVIADAIVLDTEYITQLREKRESSSLIPFVVLIDSQTKADGIANAEDVWCCIDKESEAKAIESSLECLVTEFKRLRSDGSIAQRQRRPVEASVITESFSSKEIAELNYDFPLLVQLENAGLLNLNERLRLQLALQEAIANSLEHGNLELLSEWKEVMDSDGVDKFTTIKKERLSDPHYSERIITILSDFDCSRLLIRITDQGKGFKAPDVHSSLVKERTLAVFGRGLAIINNAMDEVMYALEGRQVTLIKRIFAQGDE